MMTAKDCMNIIKDIILPDLKNSYLKALEQKNNYDEKGNDLFMSFHFGESEAYKKVVETFEKIVNGWDKK